MYKVLNNKNKQICALVIKVFFTTADDVVCKRALRSARALSTSSL